MSDINQASAEAVEAARQGDRYAELLTAIHAAQIVQQLQQPAPPPVVQQPASSSAVKWVAVAVGGSVFCIAFAFAAMALAIAALSVAMVALVSYGIYRDIRRR